MIPEKVHTIHLAGLVCRGVAFRGVARRGRECSLLDSTQRSAGLNQMDGHALKDGTELLMLEHLLTKQLASATPNYIAHPQHVLEQCTPSWTKLYELDGCGLPTALPVRQYPHCNQLQDHGNRAVTYLPHSNLALYTHP